MPQPKTASGDMIYVMYEYGQVTITVCTRWPASTTNQSDLVTLTFDILTLKVVSESDVTWATSVPIVVFSGLSVLDLGPRYATDRRRTKHHFMPPPHLLYGGGDIMSDIIDVKSFTGAGHFYCCNVAFFLDVEQSVLRSKDR